MTSNLRECEYLTHDGRTWDTGWFHRWIDEPMSDTTYETWGLVEAEDGSVQKVTPHGIEFLHPGNPTR